MLYWPAFECFVEARKSSIIKAIEILSDEVKASVFAMLPWKEMRDN